MSSLEPSTIRDDVVQIRHSRARAPQLAALRKHRFGADPHSDAGLGTDEIGQ